MANNKKTSSGKKSSSSKGRSGSASRNRTSARKPTAVRNATGSRTRSSAPARRSAPARAEKQSSGLGREITGVALVFIGVLLGIFCYFSSTGLLAAVAPVLFGVFGILTYAMPVLLIVLGVLLILVPRNELKSGSIACIIVIVLALLALIHVFTVKEEFVHAQFGASVRRALDLGALHRGGGLLGGMLGWVFVLFFGVTGAIIALFGVLLIASLLLTHFSISAYLEKLRAAYRERPVVRREKRPLYTEDLRAKDEKKRTAQVDDGEDFIDHSGKPLTSGDTDYSYGRSGRTASAAKAPAAEEPARKRERHPFRAKRDDDGLEFFPSTGLLTTGKPARRRHEQELKDSFNIVGDSSYGAKPMPGARTDRTARTAAAVVKDRVPRTDDLPAADRPASESIPANAKNSVFADVELDFDEPVGPAPAADDDPLAGVVISRYDDETDGEPAPEKTDKDGEASAENGAAGEAADIVPIEAPPVYEYQRPPLSLLRLPDPAAAVAAESPEEKARILIDTLASFNISARVVNISVGPVITRFELQPAQGVRVNRVTSLNNDIQLALAAPRVRIEAPIPGKSAIGIEIPNANTSTVLLRELLESPEFSAAKSPLSFAVGKDIAGKIVLGDLGKMPHMLVAGQTGSGKSVCINGIILSLVYKSSPKDVRMILIDPKVVELSIFSTLPHLFCPVVTDPKKAAGALRWAVNEMDARYKKMADVHARDIDRYNAIQINEDERWPRLVIIIDELADLMIVASKDVEDSICRIAQLGRACGIHLIVATQRPSVDVITGLIKANIPSRIAFAVSNGIDSRVILDSNGAEKLLGRGDMLFHPNGASKPTRAQGAFVADEEVEAVAEFFSKTAAQQQTFHEDVLSELSGTGSTPGQGNGKQEDELLPDAVRLVIESGQASISMIQRRLRVGYARAARLIDIMEQKGYVSPADGAKPRRVLIDAAEFNRIFGGDIPITGGQSGQDGQ